MNKPQSVERAYRHNGDLCKNMEQRIDHVALAFSDIGIIVEPIISDVPYQPQAAQNSQPAAAYVSVKPSAAVHAALASADKAAPDMLHEPTVYDPGYMDAVDASPSYHSDTNGIIVPPQRSQEQL